MGCVVDIVVTYIIPRNVDIEANSFPLPHIGVATLGGAWIKETLVVAVKAYKKHTEEKSLLIKQYP